MMGVIVHQHDVATAEPQPAVHLEAAADTGEIFQPGGDRLFRHSQFFGDSDGGERVEYVMSAGLIQHHLQPTLLLVWWILSCLSLQGDSKAHLAAMLDDRACAHLCVFGSAVG